MSTSTPAQTTSTRSAGPNGTSSSSLVPRLVLAWTVVGIPLAFGIYETAKKASALFTG